jgi:hypothetical protein
MRFLGEVEFNLMTRRGKEPPRREWEMVRLESDTTPRRRQDMRAGGEAVDDDWMKVGIGTSRWWYLRW